MTIFEEDYSNLKDLKGAMGLQDQAFENCEKECKHANDEEVI